MKEEKKDKPYKFFAIEGIDGAGKTTVAKAVVDKLSESFKKVSYLSEPCSFCDLGLGSAIFDHFMPTTQCLIFAANRAQHYSKCVYPLMDDGAIIITDRSEVSMLAYQGYGRDIDKEFINNLNRFVTGLNALTAVFWLDIPVDEAQKRMTNRGDMNETEKDVTFQTKVMNGYKDMYKYNPSWYRIDALLPFEGIVEQICGKIINIVREL